MMPAHIFPETSGQTPWRTASLILGALAGVPLTMFTLYGSWMELLKAAGFVLAVWGVLVGLLLVPILAGTFARSEPAS